MSFQNALSNSLKLGHKIPEQAEHLWKEHVHHPLLTCLDSHNHATFTVTHYHRQNVITQSAACLTADQGTRVRA